MSNTKENTSKTTTRYDALWAQYFACRARVLAGERGEQLQKDLDEAALEVGLGHNSYLSLVRGDLTT